MIDDSHLVHGTCVALRDAHDTWSGVLMRGVPGAGKSDLALRLIDQGARLVADDQVVLHKAGDALIARAPETIRGKIEARGIGILEVPHLDEAFVRLVCDLVAPDQVVRLPDPARVLIAGTDLPLFALAPFEASTPAKLRLGVRAASDGIIGASN